MAVVNLPGPARYHRSDAGALTPATSVPVQENLVVTGARVQLLQPSLRALVVIQNLDPLNSVWLGDSSVVDGTPFVAATGIEILATERLPLPLGDAVDLWLVSDGAVVNVQVLHIR